MSMSTPHTKTPWKLDGRMILGEAFDGSFKAICEKVRGGNPEHADGNAAYIVQAVNSHEALVEALTYLLNETEDYIKINNLSALHNHSLKMARAALALVEGKTT